MADIGHTTAAGFLGNDLAGCPLGSYEHDAVLVTGQPLNVLQGLIERWHRVLKIDDVDFVACAKNELIHFWVPEAGLVPKVCACLQQIAHAYLCHNDVLKLG